MLLVCLNKGFVFLQICVQSTWLWPTLWECRDPEDVFPACAPRRLSKAFDRHKNTCRSDWMYIFKAIATCDCKTNHIQTIGSLQQALTSLL